MPHTHCLNPCATPTESHGERMTQEPHTHWIHPCMSTPQAQFFCFICHTHICVCVWTLMQNKAGCLSFTGCGNRFASMCSLSHEGRGNKERDVALYSREICLPQRVSGGKLVRTQIQVRLLHARCTNAKQLHNPKRNCQGRESQSDKTWVMCSLKKAAAK